MRAAIVAKLLLFFFLFASKGTDNIIRIYGCPLYTSLAHTHTSHKNCGHNNSSWTAAAAGGCRVSFPLGDVHSCSKFRHRLVYSSFFFFLKLKIVRPTSYTCYHMYSCMVYNKALGGIVFYFLLPVWWKISSRTSPLKNNLRFRNHRLDVGNTWRKRYLDIINRFIKKSVWIKK